MTVLSSVITAPRIVRSSVSARPASCPRSQRLGGSALARRTAVTVRAEPGDNKAAASSSPVPAPPTPEFGHTRADVMLIGGVLIGFGFALYYGLQATGMEPGIAGNWVQFIIFVGICIGWVSTYFYRVATKQMTYVKQLEAYEEAVMAKRLEEMPDSDIGQLISDIEKEKEELQRRRRGGSAQ